MPHTVSALLNVISAIVQSPFDGIHSIDSFLECFMGSRSYQSTLIIYIVLPIAAVLLVMLVQAGNMLRSTHSQPRSVALLVEKSLPYALPVIFITYPLCTNVAFSVFDLYTFELRGGSSGAWLVRDTSPLTLAPRPSPSVAHAPPFSLSLTPSPHSSPIILRHRHP